MELAWSTSPRFLKRAVLLGTPLVLASLDLGHPADFTAEVYTGIRPDIGVWIAVHLAHLLLFGLLALAITILVDGMDDFLATASRLAAGAFAVLYSSSDAVSGMAVGTLVRNAHTLPPTEQRVIAAAVQKLFFDPLVGGGLSLLGALAVLAWLAAVLAAAGCLYRSGVSSIAVFFLILASIFFGISHAPPLGPAGMTCFFFAAVKVEWWRRRPRQASGADRGPAGEIGEKAPEQPGA